jgi:hypothetical protein
MGTLSMGLHMATSRTHIILPSDVLQEIDALVGKRGRSAFLAEIARQEVRRRRLLAFLDRREPAWKSKDHPELKGEPRLGFQRCGEKRNERAARESDDRPA